MAVATTLHAEKWYKAAVEMSRVEVATNKLQVQLVSTLKRTFHCSALFPLKLKVKKAKAVPQHAMEAFGRRGV
jgi:hypothetical protein